MYKCSVYIWKENIFEYLETGVLDFKIVEQFLKEIKKEFGGKDKKSSKVVQLKQFKQDQQTMDEYIQLFKQATRDSRYRERLLVEEFKKEMNRRIRR